MKESTGMPPTTGVPFTVNVFRGDDKQFQRFDPSVIGRSTGADTEGYWFSSSEDAAGYYGEHVRPFVVTMNNPLVVSHEEFKNGYPHGPPYFAKLAKEKGHDGVVILDILDGDRYSDVYCVWNPTQIKFKKKHEDIRKNNT